MSNNFLGEVRPFAGNFNPRSWALCNGQLMSIAQNSALFALLGTTYGGDGVTTFALPNLQGRLAISQGQGAGLSSHTLGEASGTENVTLLQGNLPVHNHMLNATLADATATVPANNLLPAKPTVANAKFYVLPGTPAPTPDILSASTCGVSGGSQPHSNLMPSLCVTYIIALEGIFPSRN